ncbi:TIR domain-containing protein [Nitrosomonas marina]|uniref:TIR domain-containing protein n=1 Tax=Nitrosomonas marina TaxID=917 RepID=A0A1I0F4W6_9PROT|nr:toll/interleukin-1 receptor domain-containing protein [Nitrosomonas marina]SET52278.1 TIR domain-containing protein [Nitrosomonas marina]
MQIKRARKLLNYLSYIFLFIFIFSVIYGNDQIVLVSFTIFFIIMYISGVYLDRKKDYEVIDWYIIRTVSRNISLLSAIWILIHIIFAGKFVYGILPLVLLFVFISFWLLAELNIMFKRKKPPQIFLSYAHADQSIVKELYQKLNEQGYKPWLDINDLKPGTNWNDEIYKAINQSDFFIVCLSKNSINREGVIQEEIDMAMNIWKKRNADDIFLIPLLLEKCDTPSKLNFIQWVNLEKFEYLVHTINEAWKNRK